MRIRALAALVVLVGAFASCGGDPSATSRDRLQVSETPSDELDFSVTTFDGETFTLSEHRGTPVVLNFWESW